MQCDKWIGEKGGPHSLYSLYWLAPPEFPLSHPLARLFARPHTYPLVTTPTACANTTDSSKIIINNNTN